MSSADGPTDPHVSAVAEEIWDLASKVWKFAELGFEEVKSSAVAQAVLEAHDFKISDRGIGKVDTAWIATWGQGAPVLGFMVEFDALPDLGNEPVPTKKPREDGVTNGHGCGHNLICSAATGGALALKAYMEAQKTPGTIKVFGCPAEELLAGKDYMSKAGAFKGLDACLHCHPGPRNVAWNFHSTAVADMIVEFEGKTAHSGVMPWAGRSALHASELFLHGANLMREHILPTARLHYYIMSGGTAVNVVPGYCKLKIRYRGPSAKDVKQHMTWIQDIATGAALATQTKAKVSIASACYDCLANDVLGKKMTEVAKSYFPIDWTTEEVEFAKSIQKELGYPEDGMTNYVMDTPSGVEVGGSSDVGDVSWQVPTMGLVFGAWPEHVPAHHWACTASHGMSLGKRAMIQAARVLASMGLDLMTKPELLEAAKKEFDKRTEGQPYECMLPDEIPDFGVLDFELRHSYDCCIHQAEEYYKNLGAQAS